VVAVLAVFLIFFGWLAISLGSALTNPSYGVSSSARFAEWGRQHGIGGVVTWLEKEWYAHHQPPKGGKPPAGAFDAKAHAGTGITASCPNALPMPPTIVSPASPQLAGEGTWHAAGRLVASCSALYEAFVRPDAVHTSYVVGVVWMDTKLLSPTLYSGSQIPGGGPYTNTAPIKPSAAMTLVSAFNAGFRMGDTNGGYYTDGKEVIPLVPGGASAVIYKNGTMNIGAWGSDVKMTPDVVSVRQNLDLIVSGGKPVPGLDQADNKRWGATLGGSAYVWRSAMGITANGAVVYVAGPGMSITALADILVRAGAIRGMELDINADWVQYSIYSPPVGQPASPANGVPLMSSMAAGSQGPSRYFQTWWVRDFFTMSAKYPANGTMSSPSPTTSTSSKKN
jgi:Phosphodiester glycosidase